MSSDNNKESWFSRLKKGLNKSSSKLTQGINDIFTKQKLNNETLVQLEDLLISADLGPALASRLVQEFAAHRFGKDIGFDKVKQALASQIADILKPYAIPLVINKDRKPFVILVVGVNGTGKTTTIGKLALRYHQVGLKVVMAAGDTFRAAAISQLKIWAERTSSKIICGESGADAAALIFQALEAAHSEKADVLLIDTAGRLHNKDDLMQELAKIVRVIKKVDPTAPHATLLVLDATTGQNAHTQVEVFRNLTSITGLVITKLDGSAKGGVLVSLVDKFKIPVHAVGVGESAEDLQSFSAEDFGCSLLGLDIKE